MSSSDETARPQPGSSAPTSEAPAPARESAARLLRPIDWPSTDARRNVGSRNRRRRHRTVTQCVGGIVIALVCAVITAWYVPRVVSANEHSMVGTVTSTGVIGLNFVSSGQIAQINVQVGQRVKKGQVLAAEYNPATDSVIQADKAAIAAAQAKITEINAERGPEQPADLAAANADLAKDQEQLDTDQASLAQTRVIAPTPGVVVAVNGEAGETVTAQGIRDFSSMSGSAAVGQQPQFSLLPEGPQSTMKTIGSAGMLPVVVLHVSDNWNVVVLIPESRVASIRTGQKVTIAVPAAKLSGVPGRIVEVLPTPQLTSQGVVYQAVVSVFSNRAHAPLSGMSADVELDS